jgi:hypothetical protein
MLYPSRLWGWIDIVETVSWLSVEFHIGKTKAINMTRCQFCKLVKFNIRGRCTFDQLLPEGAQTLGGPQ